MKNILNIKNIIMFPIF